MKRFAQHFGLAVLLGTTLGIAGCNDGGDSDSGASTGTVSFDATDGPVDNVDVVKLVFDRIELKPKSGPVVSVSFDDPDNDQDGPVVIPNLLDLTGDASEPILGDTTVSAGEYSWVRLYVVVGPESAASSQSQEYSMVVDNQGQEFPLYVPGSQPQSQNDNSRFLHLNSGFIVPAGGDADFTIDFVLRKALTQPSNKDYYLLRPAHRLINNVEVGTISGTVDPALVTAESCADEDGDTNTAQDPALGNSVYLYADQDAAVGDIYVDPNSGDEISRADEVNPITTSEVVYDSSTDEYRYTIGFVAEGDYTVAFTCQTPADVSSENNDIAFPDVHNASVAANEETTQDFTAPVMTTTP